MNFNPVSRASSPKMVAAVSCAALVLGVAACSTNGDEVEPQSAVSMRSSDSAGSQGSDAGKPNAETGGTSAVLESDPAPEGEEFSLNAAEAAPAEGSYLGIKDVRIGSHDGYDRIVFEFTGEGKPGYWVRYDDIPAQQGSGKAISVAGAKKLAIDIRGTGYPFDFNMEDFPSDPVRPTDTKSIEEVVGAGTFEGSSQYVAGVRDERQPFRAFLVENPTRLIVDIEAK
ncbi:AMIN-like domain-containing (lipo)protein [Corynebacterium sp. H113]|uniref:AMIN-like domain-containing (lipo)protein n=1 Tax=Corynebacterium sp. H113 TaxID=3133419 RepID=UPI00309DD870